MSAEDIEKKLLPGDGIFYSVGNSWNTENGGVGAQLSLTVTNDTETEMNGWERTLTIVEGATVKVDQFWSCSVSVTGNVITITPAEYNKTIAAGGMVRDIGIILMIE